MTTQSAISPNPTLPPDPATAGEDDVIFAFLCACPLPSPADVAEWGRRYPTHAETIAEYAVISLEVAFSRDMTVDDPEDDEVERPLQRRATIDLPALVREADTTIAKLSRQIGIDRGILADLVAGRIRLPVPPKLLRAIAASLDVAVERVVAALSQSFEKPRMGFANSSDNPSASVIGFAESVAESDMSEERKAYWLAEE